MHALENMNTAVARPSGQILVCHSLLLISYLQLRQLKRGDTCCLLCVGVGGWLVKLDYKDNLGFWHFCARCDVQYLSLLYYFTVQVGWFR